MDKDIYLDLIKDNNPSFANFSNPSALNTDQVMDNIEPNQMIVSYHLGKERMTVFVIVNDDFYFFDNPLSEDTIKELVNEFRENFDVYSDLYSFDYKLAYQLYELLFPFPKELFLNVEELTIVPSGTLLSLPFAALITNPNYNSFEEPSWLIKQFPISYLPSINSIDLLSYKTYNANFNSFVGFGDPIFDNYEFNNTRGVYNDLLLADLFAPLPETKDELEQISRSLGVNPKESLYLGHAARESVVKSLDLFDKNIIMFATHGIISGDLSNIYEPGLILSQPSTPSEFDDGVLTSSEIMDLYLNADWVLLSACNTAAGENENSNGLSGLAKSFFYAGAKSLLVSQWPVESFATVELTTGIFDSIKKNSNLNKSQALRNSMLKLMEDEEYSHPFYWAPFILVGQI